MTERSHVLWERAYRDLTVSGRDLMWPSETLVRLLKGPYVADLPSDFTGCSVLDVGFGTGSNLMFLGSTGFDLAGVEVTSEICSNTHDKLQNLGFDADLRIGTNRSLPFEDESFDYLVSWNVLHYEETAEAIEEAIREYARVLKKGGRLFLSTTGPKHKILTGAERLEPHRYQIGRSDDFRKGQVFFYFDTAEYLEESLSVAFQDIAVGRTRDKLLTEVLDSFIAVAVA